MTINRVYKISALFIIACILITYTSAQNTYNPSSMYGLGEVDMSEYGTNTAMGSVSMGIQSGEFLNNSNPASLSNIDSATFLYDFALSGKYSLFKSGKQSESALNGNFRKIAMGFQVMPRWGSSIGISPYSTVGYNLQSSQSIEGSTLYETVYYSGSGGINKIFWGNSLRLTPKISVGANTSFLFGSIQTEEKIGSWSMKKTSSTKKIYIDFGMQYTDKLNDNIKYTFGGVFGYKDKLNMKNSIISTVGDTVNEDKTIASKTQYLPMFYGFGLSAKFYDRYTFAADYQFQKWSDIVSNFPNIKYSDVHKVKFGFEMGSTTGLAKNYFQRMHYRAGFILANSYLTRNNKKPVNYAVTCGVGLPIRYGSMLNVGMEYGRIGLAASGLISEDYAKICLSMTIRDSWFVKKKYD